MDLQAEQAVWRRVRGPGPITAEETVLPERLEGLLVQEQADAAALRTLARRMGGQGSASLSRVAAATEARVRQLTALHYLLTGRKLRLQTPPYRIPASLPEALREICLRMEQTAKTYRSLEAEFSERGELFSRFARQSREQAQTLLNQLQNRLPRQTEP